MMLVMLLAQVVIALLLVAGSVLVLALVRALESAGEPIARPRLARMPPPAAASDELDRAA